MASDDDDRRWQDAEDDRRRQIAEDDRRRQNDEDDRRRQDAEEDDRRRQNDEDDRRWSADREAERKSRFDQAMREGDHDTARWILGVPPTDTGALSPVEPERAEPPTAGEQFREHKQALLFNLEWVYDFLPQELCRDRARRVEPLDLEQAEAGLPVIEAIREEYQNAAARHEPPITEVSRRMDWNYYVPRIGDEIEWVIALFRQVLPPW